MNDFSDNLRVIHTTPKGVGFWHFIGKTAKTFCGYCKIAENCEKNCLACDTHKTFAEIAQDQQKLDIERACAFAADIFASPNIKNFDLALKTFEQAMADGKPYTPTDSDTECHARRAPKTASIPFEEYDRLSNNAYVEMCATDKVLWRSEDFFAGFMAAFNYFSKYEISQPKTAN